MTDVTTGQRIWKIRAHREIVNTLDRTIVGSGTELLATGSDDGTVKIWEGGDEASKQAVATFEIGCPVTSVCWNKEGNAVYVGAIDNEVHVCLNSFTLFLLFMYFLDRYTISAKGSKHPRLQDTPILPHPWPCRPTGLSSSLLPFHHKLSSGMCVPLLTTPRVYTGFCKVPQQDSKTPSYAAHGVRTMVASELL